ncbi:hypothetical protein HOY82DRAFT_361664 [Tuber indicum]|nr:hypothetical protein HOY82DRAFT_361664 [Tuber indicum]
MEQKSPLNITSMALGQRSIAALYLTFLMFSNFGRSAVTEPDETFGDKSALVFHATFEMAVREYGYLRYASPHRDYRF